MLAVCARFSFYLFIYLFIHLFIIIYLLLFIIYLFIIYLSIIIIVIIIIFIIIIIVVITIIWTNVNRLVLTGRFQRDVLYTMQYTPRIEPMIYAVLFFAMAW